MVAKFHIPLFIDWLYAFFHEFSIKNLIHRIENLFLQVYIYNWVYVNWNLTKAKSHITLKIHIKYHYTEITIVNTT